MAQQSARRGRKNQGFPQCLEHALGDLDPARELPYRPAATRVRIRGRTDGSIRLRAKTILKFSLDREGASTDGKPIVCFPARRSKSGSCPHGRVWAETQLSAFGCATRGSGQLHP